MQEQAQAPLPFLMLHWCMTLLMWVLRAPPCPGAWGKSQLGRGCPIDRSIILCYCSYSFVTMGKFSCSQENVFPALREHMDIGQRYWCGHCDLWKKSKKALASGDIFHLAHTPHRSSHEPMQQRPCIQGFQGEGMFSGEFKNCHLSI